MGKREGRGGSEERGGGSEIQNYSQMHLLIGTSSYINGSLVRAARRVRGCGLVGVGVGGGGFRERGGMGEGRGRKEEESLRALGWEGEWGVRGSGWQKVWRVGRREGRYRVAEGYGEEVGKGVGRGSEEGKFREGSMIRRGMKVY